MSNASFDIEEMKNGSIFSFNNKNNSSVQSDADYFMDFWLDGMFKLVVGLLGIFMNSIAIWILVSERKMQKMFLHILTCSLISDNGFLITDMFCNLYHKFKVSSLAWILPYTAYPFKDIFYTSNILTTLALSYERYSQISDTTGEYSTMNIARFRHQRLRKHVLFISLFSFLFCLPSFFSHEISFNSNGDPIATKSVIYETNQYIWRLLDGCVKWSTILVCSFSVLVFYNWKIFTNIKEKLKVRRELKVFSVIGEIDDINDTAKIKTKKNLCSRISMIRKSIGKEKFITALFGLVTAFLFFNSWYLGEKILTTISSEMKHTKAAYSGSDVSLKIISGEDKVEDSGFETFLCNYRIISRVMRMLNSCTNVLIYCMADEKFRALFKIYLKRLLYLMTCKCSKSIKPLNEDHDLRKRRSDSQTNISKLQSHPHPS
jgi:hypothetical protein